VSFAKLFEEKFHPSSLALKHKFPYFLAKSLTQNTSKLSLTANTNPPINTNPLPLLPTPPKPNNLKHLTPANIQFRWEKGICFTCDEKYSPTHQCVNKYYFLLQCEDEIPPEPDPNVQSQQIVQNQSEEFDQTPNLSYNAMKSNMMRGTIRFTRFIQGHKIQILIDGGSSDNFIQPRVDKFLHLPIYQTPRLKVLVDNWEQLECEGEVQNIPVQIQEHSLYISAYVLPIAGAELVLGSQWLATVDTHLVNYKERFLTFYINGEFITLHGETSNLPSLAQFHQLTHLQAIYSIVELHTIQIQTPDVSAHHLLELPTSIEPELAMIIQQYKNVFEKPHGLQPIRSHDHTIPLMPGSTSVKVGPYRYPYSQKIEIEQIIAEMLLKGIIQSSSSPFSSPVLLVKKKDGTWHFYTDYRALNAVTIKDSFPMPTMDELLDELFGAPYFSKLDLHSGYHQILVSLEDRYNTTFGTHQGLYEWLVMQFGLSNVPPTFQALMNSVFAEYLRKFVLVFFDDILIYSTTWNTHIQHLSLVLSTMQRHSLFAKLSKCSFGQTQIDYLGHVVSRDRVKVDETKIQTIK